MIKNVLYFIVKNPSFTSILGLLGQVGKWLKWKLKLISKFVTLQTGLHTITIHELPNISRRKCNKAIKFGQLTKHNMKNIFLAKSYSKCGGEACPRNFYKKSKLSIYLDHQSEILYSLFLSYVYMNVYQNIVKLWCWSIALALFKAF